MSHTALARTYRPKRFADVAAQAHVSETLRHAVATDRVGHAYLFCGPRGVGKTTLARVLAMALNCARRGDDGEPCGECESCTRIWGGHTSLDVIEVDAASNRGVDDARSLRERAMYAPSDEERFKVYIVDEAHMLTREAWNALLKILEEPPPRVIFAFATTEPQKIKQFAAPILSRCQRFDFRRIGVSDIVARLEQVLAAEGIESEPDALRQIARKADGGMRDALSLTDQVLALTGRSVSLEAVHSMLGLVEEERVLELLDILADRRHADVFRFVEALVDDGYDVVEFYYALLDMLRTVLRLRLQGDASGLDLPTHLAELAAARGERFEVGDLVRMLALGAELESSGNLRRIPNPRILVEMLLLRYSYLDRTVTLESLLEELGGAPAGSGPEGTGRGEGRASGASTSAPRPAASAASAAPSAQAAPPPAPPAPTLSARAAYDRVLEEAAGLPPGLAPFLRTADVAESEPGVLTIRLAPGPGLERASDPMVRGALVDAIGRFTVRAPTLRVEAAGGDPEAVPTRVTPETVRQTRLSELFQREPRLRRAVEELDLELLE